MLWDIRFLSLYKLKITINYVHKSLEMKYSKTVFITDMSEKSSQIQSYFFFFYLSEAVGCQVQRVQQSVVLHTFHARQVVVGAAQVEESVHVAQSCGADQLIVI